MAYGCTVNVHVSIRNCFQCFATNHNASTCSDCSYYQLITNVVARDISVSFGPTLDFVDNPIVIQTGSAPFLGANIRINVYDRDEDFFVPYQLIDSYSYYLAALSGSGRQSVTLTGNRACRKSR